MASSSFAFLSTLTVKLRFQSRPHSHRSLSIHFVRDNSCMLARRAWCHARTHNLLTLSCNFIRRRSSVLQARRLPKDVRSSRSDDHPGSYQTATFSMMPLRYADQTALKQARPATVSSVKDRLSDVSKALGALDSLAEWQLMQDEIHTLEKDLQKEEIWSDSAAAMKAQTRLAHLKKQLITYKELAASYKDLSELASLLETNPDALMENEIIVETDSLQSRINSYLVTLWLSEPLDSNSAYINIHAGSGGTEACDWAAMLARMYTRWAQDRNFGVQFVEETPGDVAGIKSTTLLVEGPYAYGYAQYESGVHRLVRISPFDRAGARHTSFASVRVSPRFDDNIHGSGIDIDIKPSDLKITTMRSQGAGGQHVNKTESAVRVVHMPTGITVTCQQERSQHRNRLLALSLLRTKLYEMEQQKRDRSKVDAHHSLPENAWGSQVRSYVLQPYQLVKDTRTGYEISGNAHQVLDGDLNGFMEACLRKFRAKV